MSSADEFSIPALPKPRAHASSVARVSAAPPDLSSTDPALWPQGASELKDASVQGTSDDAATSKCSAQSLGYFQDDFLQYFVPVSQRARRPPLINRGYWARVAAVTQMIDDFLRAGEEGHEEPVASETATATAPTSGPPPTSPFFRAPPPAAAPPPFPSMPAARVHKQIISLGAGSDTNYFKLKSAGRAPFRYVEIDFPVAMQRKAQTIRHTPHMLELVTKRTPQQTEEEAEAFAAVARAQVPDPTLDLPSSDYALVGADMRDLDALEEGLRHAQVDFSLPTLILSECVLIYMEAVDSTRVLRWLTDRLTGGALVWCYEQIHPFDAFGATMRANLQNRGCSLLGFLAYPDLAAHRERYLSAGFDHYAGWDMNDVYRYCLRPLSEVKRIERLELFDEFEEWNMIQAHYHVSVASKEPSDAAASPTINWSRIGMLGMSKQPSVLESAYHSHTGGSIVTGGGRTVLLGGAGLRASAPLQPATSRAPSNTANPAKGSLRKPAAAAPATTAE